MFFFAGKRCSNTGIGQETAPTSAAKPASQPPAGGIRKRNDDKPWDSGVITLFFMDIPSEASTFCTGTYRCCRKQMLLYISIFG